MHSTEVFDFGFLFVLFFFLGHDKLLFGVPLELFSFDVFEHEFAFGKADVVRENFAVGFVELDYFRKAAGTFGFFVLAFEEFGDVIVD